MKITSTAFEDSGKIPKKYTCEGQDINPPLQIEDIPEGTESLALIMDDPDAPMGTFVHWVVWNIPPVNTIAEDSNPGMQGNNTVLKKGYMGPCPPSGEHRYFFKLYALNSKLDLKEGADKNELLREMQGKIIKETKLLGVFSR